MLPIQRLMPYLFAAASGAAISIYTFQPTFKELAEKRKAENDDFSGIGTAADRRDHTTGASILTNSDSATAKEPKSTT
ncbi:hypothetical protein BD410DRAFT_782146 [Rickenella mellea]|uniref:Uncharacterized protein n=1 Tax=Rickenella mellea TaxID=50990 RepID=A0A4Y7QLQ8_9AGAM|nr:hypothetical protein BD410DRAFT_782146 [Rickenella mellea]